MGVQIKNLWNFFVWGLLTIFLFIQGIFLTAYNPGLMSPDSYDQLEQARNFVFNNIHPLFSTLYVYIFDKLFGSPIGVSIANSCLFFLFLLLLVDTFKSNKKLLLIVLAFYCIWPIYHLFNISLLKDVPYSYFFAMGIVFLYRLILNGKLKDLIAFLFCILMVGLFRHNGLTIVVASIFALLLLDKITLKIKFISIIALIISFVLVRNVLFSLLPGARTPRLEKKSIYYVILLNHISSLPNNGDKKLIKELKVLAPVISPDMLVSSYYPVGDRTKLLYLPPGVGLNHKKVIENRKLILTTFIKLFFRYPTLMLKSILIHGSLVWNPIISDKRPYSVVPPRGNICSKGQKGSVSYYKCTETSGFSDINDRKIKNSGFAAIMDNFINKYSHIFFMKPVIYMFILIFSVVKWMKIKKGIYYKKTLILLLPLLIEIITMFIFAQQQDFRYFYSPVTIAPAFLLIMYGLNSKKRE